MNDAEREMRDAFITIMTRGRKDNTYKFALARYLLDYSQRYAHHHPRGNAHADEPIEIPYERIASKFLKYYWHQECKFKIRQSGHVEKLPHIVKIIRDEFGTEYIPYSLKDADKESVKNAKREILKQIFGYEKHKTSQVVPKFQNIPKGNTVVYNPIFYEYEERDEKSGKKSDNRKILLKPSALEFFNKYHTILMKSVILEWAKFLEKFNHIPYLITKIESAEKKRTSLREYYKIFKEFRECFYCRKTLTPNNIEIDHFIPWSYIFEDEAWNLVPSCKECNRKKSDSLPSRDYLDRLIDRNTDYQEKLEDLGKSIAILNTNKGWQAEIEYHYENCKDYGFTVIEVP